MSERILGCLVDAYGHDGMIDTEDGAQAGTPAGLARFDNPADPGPWTVER